MKKRIVLFTIILFSFILLGCTSLTEKEEIKNHATKLNETNKKEQGILEYTASGCFQIKTKTIDAFYNKNGGISGSIYLPYVCCANLTLKPKKRNNTLEIYIDNVGEECKCLCSYKILFNYSDSDIDKLAVYGVKYKDIRNYSMLGITEIKNYDRFACRTDKDCVNAFSCCHRGANICINRNYVKKEDCNGVVCTTECRQCAMCRCINQRCETDIGPGCC